MSSTTTSTVTSTAVRVSITVTVGDDAKVLAFAAVAFVVFFVATNPSGAAVLARHLGHDLAQVASGVGTFFAKVAA